MRREEPEPTARTCLIAASLACKGDMNTAHSTADLAAPSAAPPAPASAPRLVRPSPTTLADLVEEFEARAATHAPDVDVPVRDLAMNEAGAIEVPGRGPCELTGWSRHQLAARLGVRWDKWFDLIDPRTRAEEVNRRFAAAPDTVRVKTTVGPEPILRGVVSPTYSTVDDTFVARSLVSALGADARVTRRDITDRTTGYVVAVGAPLRFGGHANVGDVAGGLLIRNSDVGFASLIACVHVTRLICLNGLVVAEDRNIVHARHRHVDFAALGRKLQAGLADLPSRIQQAGRLLERAAEHRVADIEAALVEVLRLAHVPRRLLPLMTEAYSREPSATAFGISQAITLGVQDARVTPEDRVALEVAAGQYLAAVGGA